MEAPFSDCESCAFHDSETVICDDCDDADQWEPAEPLDLVHENSTKPVKFYDRHSRKWKKVA